MFVNAAVIEPPHLIGRKLTYNLLSTIIGLVMCGVCWVLKSWRVRDVSLKPIQGCRLMNIITIFENINTFFKKFLNGLSNAFR